MRTPKAVPARNQVRWSRGQLERARQEASVDALQVRAPAALSRRMQPLSSLSPPSHPPPHLPVSRMGAYENGGSIPIITKGEGVYIFDDRGKK